MACRLATCPTSRSPFLVNPTTDGVVRPPSSLGMTFGSPPSMTATTEFVVPKSIPIILPISCLLNSYCDLYDCLLYSFERARLQPRRPDPCHPEREPRERS